jgi:hypothetical protein
MADPNATRTIAFLSPWRTVLVGVRPEIAQSIVGLGIGTSPTLAAASRSLQLREKARRR